MERRRKRRKDFLFSKVPLTHAAEAGEAASRSVGRTRPENDKGACVEPIREKRIPVYFERGFSFLKRRNCLYDFLIYVNFVIFTLI